MQSPEEKVSLGCVMLEAPSQTRRTVKRIQDEIRPDSLVGDGLEEWPHVTVFYGIVDTSISDVVAMVRGFSPVELSFGEISTFDKEDESVLKVEIESSQLRKLNQKIKDTFPSRQTFKDYKPHMTIGYVKPHRAKPHKGKCSLTGNSAMFTHAVVSIGGEKQRINLSSGAIEPESDKYTSREDKLFEAILSRWSPAATIERYALSAWNDYDLRLDDDRPIVDRYEWNAGDHPRFAAGSPGSVGGEFRGIGQTGGSVNAIQTAVNSASKTSVQQVVKGSSKRELAALPDIQKDHHLHHSKLPPALQNQLLDWNGRINQLLNPMNIAAGQTTNPETREAVKDAAFKRLDKTQIRDMLDEMNQMDREARKFGVPLSDFVNANGIIPRELAERLNGGARFFDPEKLRGKLKAPEDSKQGDSSLTDFKEATKTDRKEMLANPSMREAIERAMGLKPSKGGEAKPEPAMEGLVKPESESKPKAKPSPEAKPEPKPTSSVKHLPEANRALRALGYKPNEAGALLRKTIAAGTQFDSADDLVKAALTGGGNKHATSDNLSSAGSGKLDAAINEAVGGDDLDKKEHFKKVALDAWKEMKSEADNHNDALRQLTSFFGKHHGALAANISKGTDVTKIKGFDELIDHAVREYPQLISRLGSESSAGGPEDALVDALKEGIREVPQPWDNDVIDKAMQMVGPGFFEDTPAMAGVSDAPIEWDDGPTPFSVRSDVLAWVQRYWMRELAIAHWVDKYSCEFQTAIAL